MSEREDQFTPWGIKEALAIALVYVFLCILGLFTVSVIFPSTEMLPDNLHSFLLALSSVALASICLLWLHFIKGESFKKVGLVKCKQRHYLYAFLLAVGLYLLSRSLFEFYFANLSAPVLTEGYSIWRGLNAFIFAPIAEEIYYRGILFQAFRKKFRFTVGAVLSALLFGFLHVDPRFSALWYILLGPSFLLGLVAAILFHYSRSLFPAFFCHAIFNILSESFGG